MTSVVIVGAGPTGITAATLLAQYGIECLVLDRWSSVYPQPRAVHLDDEIFRVLARLGVAEEFAAISRPARGLRLLDNTTRVLAEFHRDPANSVHGFPQANMFDQPDLEELLRANLKHYPSAQLRGDAEVTDIADDGQGRILVTFCDRADGTKHVVDATYVLGCDGANSVVRSCIGIDMHDLKFDQRWLVVDIATTADLDQWDGVHQVCDPIRAATYMRIGESRYRWEFQLLAGETADDYTSLEALRPLIAPWVGDLPPTDLALVRVTGYTFRAKVAERWRRGNIFLLGDAAHLTPPFIGQGLGAGLRDAMNLAWKLVGVLEEHLPPTVLDTYEQERKPHTRFMIGMALSMGWAMTAGGDAGNLIRRLVVPRLHLVPGLRDKLVESRTPALRRSALVSKGRAPWHLAGTLCPNPATEGGGRLDVVLGNGFAMVTTQRPYAFQCTSLEERGAVVHIAEPGSELARWLRHGRATAAIIRPDRTVMCAGRDLSAVCAAMPRFSDCTTHHRKGTIDMTVDFAHTYTDPPPRVSTELSGGGAQDLFQRVQILLDQLPEPEPVRTNTNGEREQLGDTTVVHRFVDAPGDSETVTWHYVEAGDPSAPTVVFLHGVPDSWWQWHYALEELSDRYHCVAIDLKGYGQSDKRTGDYRQQGVAGQIHALLDTIGISEFVLVTHDRGTPPGDHLVSALGDRVIGYARGQQHLWHLHPSLHPQEQLFTSLGAPGLLADAQRFVATAYTWLTDHPVAASDIVRTIEEFSHTGIATAVPRYFHSSSFRQEWIDRRTTLIESWTAPVLVLQGKLDPVQPHEFYTEPDIVNMLPAGSRVHLFDTGHFWPFEAPHETVDVIRAFVDTVTG